MALRSPAPSTHPTSLSVHPPAPAASRAVAILVSSLVATSGVPPSVSAQDAPLPTRVDEVFADVDSATTPGCAVSVMEDGAVVYERGYGMANLEYGIPITPRSVFHVASVSKQFTALAVTMLAHRGELDLDDDVREYVPEVPDFGPTVTIRHLLHHTSGLRDQWSLLAMAGWRFEADVITRGDVLDITSRQRSLNFPPGDEYLYSNTGYTLLAVIVERVAGRSLRGFMQDEVFGPLGMTDTHFHDDHNMIVPRRAYAYTRDEEGLHGLRLSIPDFDVVGATSLFTTVHDLAAWDRNFYTARVGGRDVVDTLLTRGVLSHGDTLDYAFGLGHGSYRGLPTVGHGGADAGYRAQFLRFPEQRFTTAVLCNFPWSNPGSRARRVADVYLEDAFSEPPPGEDDAVADEEPESEHAFVELPEERLRDLAGLYKLEDGRETLTVRFEDGRLVLPRSGGDELRPLGDDRFLLEGTELVLTLTAARDGEPGRLETPEALGSRVYLAVDPWAPPPEELRAFEGRYRSEELGTDYVLVVDGDELVRTHRKLEDASLEPTWEDAFRLRGSTLVFQRGPSGRITGFRISSGRVRDVVFRRVER